MNFRDAGENKCSMEILAILGLLISTVCIGFAGQWALQLLGREVPLLVTLLFYREELLSMMARFNPWYGRFLG
jgi:monovalent cation:H+ antiporter, CPA1 family